MAWNTSFTRFYSTDLALVECGSFQKIPRRDKKVTLAAQYTGDLEVGQCVAMMRVPTGARIVNADLTWGGSTTASVLAVGDPYACARFLGPINTTKNRGEFAANTGHCIPYGQCGKMEKTGREGDGCGRWYQYTCETDILITNLYHDGFATLGGWRGAQGPATVTGAKWTGGTLVLVVEYLPAS